MDMKQLKNLPKEEKIIIAATTALANADPSILVMGILTAVTRSMPDPGDVRHSSKARVAVVLAAMGLVQSITDEVKRQKEKAKKKEAETKEVPDSAFSEEDKAKAQEILAGFMARSKAHIKGES